MGTRIAALAACFTAGVLGCSAGPAASQGLNQFVGFGDSTVDTGWYRNLAFPTGNPAIDGALPSVIPGGGGVSTTGPDPMSASLLAGKFGLTADPANQGGSNYATGGARNNQTGSNPNAVPTVTQIANYLTANNGAANGRALYLIGSGGNDVSLYAGKVANNTITLSQGIQNVTQSANDLASAVEQLKSAGARYLLIPNQPQSFGSAAEQALRTAYNATLWNGLATAGVNFIPVDWNGMIKAVAANPASFGLIPNAGPACQKPAGINSGWAILCTPATLVAVNADQTHLFADDIHLSGAGQKILANYEYSLLAAPGEISFLAEVPLAARLALIGTIRNQIALSSEGQRGPSSINGWITGDLSRLKIENSPGFSGDPGTPVSLAVGFDRRTGDWVSGFSISANTTRQSFGLGGNFRQSEIALSAYSAFARENFWLNSVVTAGYLRSDIDRIVPVGIAPQSNKGRADGFDLSWAAETGYKYIASDITHGPVVGVILQHIHINDFTENGGFTALSYGDQNRDSAVTELGYQASTRLGPYEPFVKASWNHELASLNRLVTASLTTMVAPSFSMPAVIQGRDWIAFSAGINRKINSQTAAYVAVSDQLGWSTTTNIGVQIGVNSTF